MEYLIIYRSTSDMTVKQKVAEDVYSIYDLKVALESIEREEEYSPDIIALVAIPNPPY